MTAVAGGQHRDQAPPAFLVSPYAHAKEVSYVRTADADPCRTAHHHQRRTAGEVNQAGLIPVADTQGKAWSCGAFVGSRSALKWRRTDVNH